MKFSGFKDFDFSKFKIESIDKSYCKVYQKDQLLGKIRGEVLLRDKKRIKKSGGARVFIRMVKIQKIQSIEEEEKTGYEDDFMKITSYGVS